jgi:hypothetical protein
MKSNSNTNITNFTVDPVTQQITSLEVNGEVVKTGGADLDENKTATIDVSTYTEPVVVNPTSGKDGMKKATITLTNLTEPSRLYKYGLVDNEMTDEPVIFYSKRDDLTKTGNTWETFDESVLDLDEYVYVLAQAYNGALELTNAYGLYDEDHCGFAQYVLYISDTGTSYSRIKFYN